MSFMCRKKAEEDEEEETETASVGSQEFFKSTVSNEYMSVGVLTSYLHLIS